MDRLLNVLSSATVEPGSSPLTRELAREINKQVGQYLSDETPTKKLIVPNRRIERKVERLNTVLLGTYNQVLRAVDRAHYSTIGSIRDTHASGFTGRHIGDVTVAFVKTAFARPQGGK